MDINQVVKNIPKPILVIGILVLSIVFFVYNDPLRDECEVQTSIFEKKTQGVLSSVKKNGKVQFAQINYWKDRCKAGNSIGSCNDYFEGLRFVTKELREVNEGCQIKYIAENESLSKQIVDALRIISLVAWGEKPPMGISERIGWLNESHIRTFCYLKKTFVLANGEDNFLLLREKVYREFPGEWSEKFDIDKLVASNSAKGELDNKVDVEKLVAENRPRAYKTDANPSGKLTSNEIFERSIFSIRCDMYM